MWCKGPPNPPKGRALNSHKTRNIESSLDVWNGNKVQIEDMKFSIVMRHRSLPPQVEREGEVFTNYKKQQNR